MKYLKKFLREKKGKTALAILLLLGQVIGTLLIPALIGNMVDLGILKGDMHAIGQIGMQMLVIAVLAAAVSVWGSYATADLGALFGHDMRKRLLAKTQELSVQQFNALGVSSMITRATSDIANLQQTMGLVLQLVVPAPIIFAVAVVMTAKVNVWIAIVLIAFMLLFVVFTGIILMKSGSLSQSIQVRLDRINQVVRESITGVRVIRAFGNEAHEAQRSGQAFEQYAANMIRLNKLFASLNPAVWILMGLCMAAIVAVGGVFSLYGTMEVGEITAVSEYAVITLMYLILAAATAATLPKTRACLERLEEVLDTDPSVTDQLVSEEACTSHAPLLSFEDVSFAYPGAEEAVLQNISFSCRAGETTAMIGSTGSGKSTAADLLLRFHDIRSGHIRIEGRDIRSMSQEELREKIGCVPQKAFLFSGTIAENLRMGRENVTEKEMWDALRIAQAESFVTGLPKQLNAPVAQGGSDFSGGQRQRLSIARALVKKASVFVFDDSFSALDVKTDAALRKSLSQGLAGPAKLIITQRVSSIIDADQILVLDEGKLVGRGTHSELMMTCSVYQDIVTSQMKRKEASA